MHSRRTRVLFLLPSLGGGGAERVMVTLANRLDRTRFEPHLGVLEKTGPSREEVRPDVIVHDLRVRRVRYGFVAAARLAWQLRPRAVLSTLGELNLMLILVRPLLPGALRLLVRESTVVSSRLERDVTWPRLLAALYGRLYPKADAIICPSEYVLRDLVEHLGVPRSKLTRICNPLDVDRVRRLAELSPNPYQGPGPHLVSAGRLVPVKAFDRMLEAMSALLPSFPGADLTILGEGPLEAELRALAGRLQLAGCARFGGFQANPYPWLSHADLFVLSSHYEGLPNAVLEALALGTPVVAVDCPGGAREVLERCPIGRLVQRDDAQALAAAIAETLNSPKPGTSDDLETFLDPFRAERVVRQYEYLLSPERAGIGD
jgi:glycosyltransferase involved in cell wall biosynthesis